MTHGKSPAFQFYPKDFMSDERVALMTLEERGAYITLICFCWNEGSIPCDVKRLARLVGTSQDHMEDLWKTIDECFEPGDEEGRLVHPRLERERRKQARYRQSKSKAGKKGARARWGKKKEPPESKEEDGTAIAEPKQGHSTPNAEAMAKDGSSSASSTATASTTSSSSSGEDSSDGASSDVENSADLSWGDFVAAVKPLIRERIWQDEHPPPKAPRDDWDMRAELSILSRWQDQGYELEALLGAIDLYEGPAMTLAAWERKGNRGRLNELVGRWRKREESKTPRIGEILAEAG